MKHTNAGGYKFSRTEIQLIEQLREQPEMMERLRSILELTGKAEGPLKTADEVEELLIQELRRLGNTTLCQWATQAEARVSDELKGQDPTLRSRKKNAKVVVWAGITSGGFTQLIGLGAPSWPLLQTGKPGLSPGSTTVTPL